MGAGKSMMIAMLAKRAMTEFHGTRILVVVPSKELLVQNIEELHRVWPEAKLGVFSASVGLRQLGFDLTYATIGSVYKHADKLGRVDLILADECHLIGVKESGMWRGLIADLKRYGNPNIRVVGWTGTPFRGNGVWLTAGDQALFTHIATRVTIAELLEQGYLAPLTTIETKTHIDATSVRTSGGDYVVSELAKASDRADIVEAACDEVVAMGAARKLWLVFAVTVEHAQHICDALQRRGVAAAVVSGNMPAAERDRNIAAFRAGRVRCLVNVAVLTTGFNVKGVDFLVLLRATKSPVLYTQILGRGLRTEDGKTDCLVADFTDTIQTLGPVDQIKGRGPSAKGTGEAPHRICDSCGSQNHASASVCTTCGFEFPPPERIKHGTRASAAAVLSSQISPLEELEVTDVRYRRHTKPGSADTLRVEYLHGVMTVAKEWVSLDGEGYPRLKAEQWWRTRSLIDHIPGSVDAALEWLEYDQNILKRPSCVTVTTTGKYPSVVGYKWN